MKYIAIFIILISLLSCGTKPKHYTRRTVTANVTMPDGTEKEVYRMTEIRELESKKLVERQERIVEKYY